MAIEQISKERVAELSISGLATRPNMGGRLGRSGLTSRQLKEAFDRLPVAAIEKINEVIAVVNSLKLDDDQDPDIPDVVERWFENFLRVAPDGENELIGSDGKISDVYVPSISAGNVTVADNGGYFFGSRLEEVLAEIGANIKGLDIALSEI